MGTHDSPSRGVILGIWVVLVFGTSFCYGDDKNVLEVVGMGECADCADSNIETSHAFSGLRVSIDCKSPNGEFKTRAHGQLDKEGNFKAALPQAIFEDGKLKEECYAQLHSASATPCPAHDGLESSKIIVKSDGNNKQTFTTAGKLRFSPATCTSAFLWPYFKHPPLKNFGHPLPHKVFPPIYKKPFPPHVPLFKKPLPPPIPIYKKPLPPPVPIYKKPLPPPVPIYEKPLPPPVPIYKPKPKPPPYEKPLPPPVPIYKPKPPVFKPPPYKKPLPPPVPIYKPKPKPPVFKPPPYKKPLPPPIPIYKPKPPVFKPPLFKKPLPPPIPIYKKPLPPPIPIYKKPLPPPIYKKPLPPFPVHPFHKPLPPFPKFPKKPYPPLPKLPPKYFHHPKIGPAFPPFSPYA